MVENNTIIQDKRLQDKEWLWESYEPSFEYIEFEETGK